MQIAQDTAKHHVSATITDRVLRDLVVERWPIDRLIPYARNARTHSDEQVAQVAASIIEFGWTNPILVGGDGVVIACHARLAAARKLSDQRGSFGDQLFLDSRGPAGVPPQVRTVSALGLHLPGLPSDLPPLAAGGDARDGVRHRAHAYDKDPEPFEAAQWVTPGWPWVDPEKDMKAAERAIRDGLSTRSIECAAQGYDAVVIDAQQQGDNERADKLGLSYDSDGRKVLTGRNAGLTEDEIEKDAQADKVGVQ